MGLKFRGEGELDSAILYFINMIHDGRVLEILEDGEPYAICAYSMTNDPDTFLKKGTWDYLPHDSNGSVVYIEKLASKGWDRRLRNIIEHIILTKHQQMEYGVWHKWAKWGDRKVISKRRLVNV